MCATHRTDLFSDRNSAVAEASHDVVLPVSRGYSDVETAAIIWKCSLQKSSIHAVHKFLSEVPDSTLAKIVTEYENRDPADAAIHALTGRKQVFLLRRDQSCMANTEVWGTRIDDP